MAVDFHVSFGHGFGFGDFDLKDRELGMVTAAGDPVIAPGEYTLTLGGGQPDSGAQGVSGHFRIEGQVALPE